jgi:hypothetical protein
MHVASGQRQIKIRCRSSAADFCPTSRDIVPAMFASLHEEFPMPSGSRYRQYAEECLRGAQAATPVQRAHLLRVARTWFEIADQTDASDGKSGDKSKDIPMPRKASM